MSTGSELRDIARHEAGHALAHWWNGQTIDAIEMRPHEEGRSRVDRRNGEYAANTRAAVEGTNFIAAPSLLPEGYITMEKPAELDTDLREWVERDLLSFLAGPAVEWRNEKDAERLYEDLAWFLTEQGRDGRCCGDMVQVDDLLNLFPEEERESAWLTACRRAEVLVCRYWPELCALADRLTAVRRFEDEALDTALDETLGERPGNLVNALGSLNHAMSLGEAKVVAQWCRDATDAWSLSAKVDGFPLFLRITVEYLSPNEIASLGAEEMERPPGWYFLVNESLDDACSFPATGTLPRFLSSMVDTKLGEMRRDPDYLALSKAMEVSQ